MFPGLLSGAVLQTGQLGVELKHCAVLRYTLNHIPSVSLGDVPEVPKAALLRSRNLVPGARLVSLLPVLGDLTQVSLRWTFCCSLGQAAFEKGKIEPILEQLSIREGSC